MQTTHFTSGEPAVVITRIAPRHWHALEDDRVVGRGEASTRPDGRTFVSVDAWHRSVFDQLADAMLAELPAPLHTIVDETDVELTAGWERAGFTTRRREWEYVVPTGGGRVLPPPGVTIVPRGSAAEGPLRALDRVVRAEVEATVGWQEMPAEVRPHPPGDTVVDPALYAAAAEAGEYVGLVRVVQVTRLPRIGLIAVRADHRRRGIARALLSEVLGSLHTAGIPTASAEVNEANPAATALFESVGARRAGSNLELVRHGE
ncbi:ribosomal-protein-alanine N-acetyltransferase [Amycolatopsis sp. NBRC 101858]|uniref:GNAT family N-acetyltransferase n=1 Tax=Amycolatopsis sp. NBRC 101858 TaxID=3032200 RepID=UPI0024A199E5|nr:GNAT family N-acetyltransferase [Amycolatopsis sp. NBRC 101858]GLY34257.1 ribosomal-protein-alanine N-acetyltransferase [Amycolatopsis sp. NBRC 101858]